MVSLVACRKTGVPEPVTDRVKLESILRMESDEQRIAFNLLNGREKVALRNLYLENYLIKHSLTGAQQKMVRELIDFNKPQYYDRGSDSREYALQVFAKDWLERAKPVFTTVQLYSIGFSLQDMEEKLERWRSRLAINPAEPGKYQLNPDRSPYNNESLPNCFCNVGSSFTCPSFSVTYNSKTNSWESTMSYNDCYYVYTSPCDVEGGCGFLGMSTCDGNRCT